MRLDFDAQPIEDDDLTLRTRLDGVPIAPLVAAVAHVTGEYTLLADDLRPDPSKVVMMADDGYTPEQLERGRDLVADALVRFRNQGCKPAPQPTPRTAAPADRVRLRITRRRPSAALRGGTRLRGCRSPGAGMARRGGRTRPRAHGGGDRRRYVGNCDSPATSAGRLQRACVRKECGCGWDVVGEQLPGLPGRCAQPPLQLLVRPEPALAPVQLDATRPPRLLPILRGRVRSRRRHLVPARGRGSGVGRRAVHLVPPHSRRCRRGVRVRGECRRQRGRTAQSALIPGHPGHRFVRRSVVPLGPLGRHRRVRGEAGRRDRFRRQRRPVHTVAGRAGRAR